MSRIECVHETAVVESVLSGHWPGRADEALVKHALDCETCREVAAVATLIHDAHDRGRYEVHVPASGQVWWRAAVRARLESTETATRPMTWLHGITAAVAVGVLLAVATAAWPVMVPMLDRLWTVAGSYFPTAEAANAMASSLRLSAMLGLIAAAVLLLAPLAVYFALSDDR